MSRKYFGTDGVRGRVGQTPITPEFAMLLAQAAGRILKQQTTDGEVGVFIGKDTRVSGYMVGSRPSGRILKRRRRRDARRSASDTGLLPISQEHRD